MYCFIKVVGGEDGVFYDYVGEWLTEEHIAFLRKEGYDAEKVKEEDVPPCKFRLFGDSLRGWYECSHLGGEDFYIDAED